jgi:hypothetical protein
MLRQKLEDVRWLLVKIKKYQNIDIVFEYQKVSLKRARRGNTEGVQRKIIVPFKQWSEFLMKN